MRAARIAIPDVVDGFARYLAANPSWGALHIVLDDGNVADSDVRFCLDCAKEQSDAEGARLAGILLSMTRTQRLKLPRVAVRRLQEQAAAQQPASAGILPGAF